MSKKNSKFKEKQLQIQRRFCPKRSPPHEKNSLQIQRWRLSTTPPHMAGQITRYPKPEPEKPEPESEKPEPEKPEHYFG